LFSKSTHREREREKQKLEASKKRSRRSLFETTKGEREERLLSLSLFLERAHKFQKPTKSKKRGIERVGEENKKKEERSPLTLKKKKKQNLLVPSNAREKTLVARSPAPGDGWITTSVTHHCFSFFFFFFSNNNNNYSSVCVCLCVRMKIFSCFWCDVTTFPERERERERKKKVEREKNLKIDSTATLERRKKKTKQFSLHFFV
jgi:hypothetical protein